MRRFVAQSIGAWAYARIGGPVKSEEDPLDPTPAREMRKTLDAIRHVEQAVLGARWTQGIVLRYGAFYGPGTSLAPGAEQVEWSAKASSRWSVTPAACGRSSSRRAAEATMAAVEHGSRGAYNVVETTPPPSPSGCRRWRRSSVPKGRGASAVRRAAVRW